MAFLNRGPGSWSNRLKELNLLSGFFRPRLGVFVSDSYLLELSVPRERVVLFDRERWQRVLNLSYVGKEQEDEARFEQKMNQMGVTTYWEVFQSPSTHT